jgi:cytochrome c peroxidase
MRWEANMRGWLRALAVSVPCALVAAPCNADSAPPSPAAPADAGTLVHEAPGDASRGRIGEGDSRRGYESPAFVTRTRRVGADPAAPANLAALGRQPPLGLPPLSDPPTEARIDLGRRLFFDRRLSANGTLSCGMCHVPEQAFTQNELATPVGIEGAFVRRNAPSLYNVAYQTSLFHDGREQTLARQIWAPLLAANEMGNSDREAVVARIAASDDYVAAFEAAFGRPPDADTLGQALAAYQRVLLAGNSVFDRWYFAGDDNALDASARRGFELFLSSGCAGCHRIGKTSALFTDHEFHNTGTGQAADVRQHRLPSRVQLAPGVFVPLNTTFSLPDRSDLGRMEFTGLEADRWKYRTPMLRNVALTAPYMHDGSLKTLGEVIDFYAAGGADDPDRDPRMRPLELSATDRAALVAFLESLTADNVDELAADARTAPIGDVR